MAYLNLGTGVAAGIVIDGRIWRGGPWHSRGSGAPLGRSEGDACADCGQHGCVVTFCGGGALAKAWGRPGALPIRDIFDAADAGDPLALALPRGPVPRRCRRRSCARALGRRRDRSSSEEGSRLSADRLRPAYCAALHAGADASPFMRSLRLDERIELLPAGSPAAAFGAALVGASITEKEIVPHG